MGYKTGWMKKFINNVSTKVFAYAHVKTVYKDYANGTTLDDVLIETEDFDQSAVTESEISPVILSKINAVAMQTSNNFTLLNANKAESTEVYTREEVDNLISALKQECDWKEAVETFDDLATTYPDAEEGWTVTVKDTNIIYRYNGTAWVDIYTMIKLATESNDGLMSKADYSKLKGIEAGAQVNTITGIKGNAESSYRTGNVNLTPANLGALATNGDSKANKVTFTSNDVADGEATSWTIVSKLTSGITHAAFFQRVSQMFKNVRYLYKMLGTTDISGIGDGTCSGAISTLNSNLTHITNNCLNQLKYIAGSATLVYQSQNQLGLAEEFDIPSDLVYCYGIMASLNYATYNPHATQKVDRVCPWLDNVNDNKKISIFAYADDNDFVDGDTVTVSWIMFYK